MKTKRNINNKNKNKTKKVKNVESCMNTKCKSWLEQAKVNIEKMKKKISKGIEENEKELKKICGDEKKKEECEKLKNMILFRKNILEQLMDSKNYNLK
jgi:hypothetical protein